MIAILTIIHIFVCFVLILVVLLQTGKRADLAGAFGGGGSQTALGTRGAATILSKLTTASAIIFMVTSLTLAIISTKRSSQQSVLDAAGIKQEAPVRTQPVIPATPPETPQQGEGQANQKSEQGGQQAPAQDSGRQQDQQQAAPESKKAP